MQVSLFNELLTIIPPGSADVPDGQGGFVRTVSRANGASYQVQGRIEAIRPRGGASAINISGEGDLSEASHLCYLPPAVYDETGAVASLIDVSADTHIIDGSGRNYVVRTVSSRAATAQGVDHLELSLRLAPAP